jgi:outer membrane lipoprotein-sorting protein
MKALFVLTLVSASLALGAGSQSAPAYSLDQVLTHMEQAGRAFRSMESSIERTKVTVVINDEYKDSGKAYFTVNGKNTRIKFDFQKPEPQSMTISDGKVLLYYPKLKIAQEYLLGANQDKTEFLLVGFGPANQEIRRLYDAALIGEEVIGGKKASVIELKPKSPQAAARFKAIRLWMDQQGWIPLQTRVTEASNDYQMVRFTDVRINARVSDSVFDMKLPGDVKKSNMGTLKL